MSLLTIEIEDTPDGQVCIRTDPPDITEYAFKGEAEITPAEGYALHAIGAMMRLSDEAAKTCTEWAQEAGWTH